MEWGFWENVGFLCLYGGTVVVAVWGTPRLYEWLTR